MIFEHLYQFLSGIIMFYCVIIFVYVYKKTNKKREDVDLMKYTFDFCNNDKTNYEEFVIKFHRKSYYEEEKSLQILSQFDKISIGIKHGLFSEEIIYDYYGKYFIQFYNNHQFFIIQRREISTNSDLFIEYEKLVRRWENNQITEKLK